MKQFIWEHTVNEWKVVGIETYIPLCYYALTTWAGKKNVQFS